MGRLFIVRLQLSLGDLGRKQMDSTCHGGGWIGQAIHICLAPRIQIHTSTSSTMTFLKGSGELQVQNHFTGIEVKIMNANIGVIIRQSDAKRLLLTLPQEKKSWGDEVFEVGDVQYGFAPLSGIQLRIYPVTDFVRRNIPTSLSNEDIQYVWFTGTMLDDYEEWLLAHGIHAKESHPFEDGLLKLINQVGECSFMLAPEGERLGEFVAIDSSKLVGLIRENVYNLGEAQGFLATIN